MSRRRVREREQAAKARRRQGWIAAGVAGGVLLVAVFAWAVQAGRPADAAAAATGGTSSSLRPCPQPAGPAPATSELPTSPIACLDGGAPVDLAAVAAGRPTLVNVWGSWCPPCRDELPWFAALDTTAGDKVQIIGVDVMDTEASARDTLARLGVHYPILFDPNGSTRVSLGWTSGTPVTLFVRPDGTVAHRVTGRVDDAATLSALVRQHLGVTL